MSEIVRLSLTISPNPKWHARSHLCDKTCTIVCHISVWPMGIPEPMSHMTRSCQLWASISACLFENAPTTELCHLCLLWVIFLWSLIFCSGPSVFAYAFFKTDNICWQMVGGFWPNACLVKRSEKIYRKKPYSCKVVRDFWSRGRIGKSRGCARLEAWGHHRGRNRLLFNRNIAQMY